MNGGRGLPVPCFASRVCIYQRRVGDVRRVLERRRGSVRIGYGKPLAASLECGLPLYGSSTFHHRISGKFGEEGPGVPLFQAS